MSNTKDEKLTPHFTFSELVVTDYKDLQEKNKDKALEYRPQIQKLADFAESVREILGVPMIITSGFRCEELNKRVGGSALSQHIRAEAIDFIPLKMSAYEAFAKIMLSNIEYGQLIIYTRGISHFLHISIGSKRQKMFSAKVGEYGNVL